MNKKTKTLLATFIVTSAAAYAYAGYRAIKYVTRRKKGEPHSPAKLNKSDEQWLKNQTFEDLSITTFDNLSLKGQLLRNNSNKVAILVHGYHSNHMNDFKYFIKFYHDQGFNVFLPDNRAHGDSEGDVIGFGWLDRLDILEWIHEIQKYFNFEDLDIVLHGISMGGATVLMTSGETLSKDVKCIISDCSYTSAYEEFKHALERNHIPEFFLLPNAEKLSKRVIGYDFKDADALKQVSKSHTPTLFIHGDQDDFVPTYMVYQLYEACAAPKDLLVVEGANHADSYITNKSLYESTVKNFISKYISE